MKIWVDDVRPAPEGYVWCKSTAKTLDTLFKYRFNEITEINLDHDAGDYAKDGGDFIEVLNELERLTHAENLFKRSFWKTKCQEYTFILHTANPVGRENMRAIIQRNGWTEVM
jgi:transcriptional/translational regulatory protein YebC/TACO1